MIDRLRLGQTVLIGLPLMLCGTLIVGLGLIWQEYFLYSVVLGMTLVSFGEGISFSVLYRFALMSSNVSKGTVAAAVSVLMMFSFFIVIELVRIAYVHFHLWAYALSCITLILIWFSFPRQTLNKIMQERKERGEF